MAVLKKIKNLLFNRQPSDSAIESEADKIFVKLYPQHANKDGSFSRIKEEDIGTQRYKDYKNLYDQVKKTRRNKTYNVK